MQIQHKHYTLGSGLKASVHHWLLPEIKIGELFPKRGSFYVGINGTTQRQGSASDLETGLDTGTVLETYNT